MAVSFQQGIESNPRLAQLVTDIERVIDRPGDVAPRVAAAVKASLRHIEPIGILDGIETAARDDGYAQHCVHLDPSGRFSVIALAWKPGQFTPIHTHRCWGVVSILEGIETETTFSVDGLPGDVVSVSETGETSYRPGDVCWFVPPEDVHRVMNAGGDLALSLHVYGCDYGETATSILRCFDEAAGNTIAMHGHTATMKQVDNCAD